MFLWALMSGDQIEIDGDYEGFIEMCLIDSKGKKYCYQDPSNKKAKWYHKTLVNIKGDSIFFDQSPVSINRKDTLYSASEGGFYYYKGIIIKTEGPQIAKTILSNCDYCPQEVIFNSETGKEENVVKTKDWKIDLAEKGIVIDKIFFRKK